MTAVKRCSKCKQERALDCFNKRQSASDGLNSWCKTCHNSATKQWKDANPDAVKAQSAVYYEQHKTRKLETALAWRKARPGYWRKYNRNRKIAAIKAVLRKVIKP